MDKSKLFFYAVVAYAIFVTGFKVKTTMLDNALREREQLIIMKRNTEAILSRDGDPRTRQVFRNLGYTIQEPRIQMPTVPVKKK